MENKEEEEKEECKEAEPDIYKLTRLKENITVERRRKKSCRIKRR